MKRTISVICALALSMTIAFAQTKPFTVLENYTVALNEKGAKVGKVVTTKQGEISIAKDESNLFMIDKEGNLSLKKKAMVTNESPMSFEISIQCGDEISDFEIVKDEFIKNKVVAHRGAWKHHNVSQNSVGSLKAAIALGCQGSEFDVWQTTDGQVILNHDGVIDGLVVEDNDLATMRAKPRLKNGEYMAVLEDYINTVKTQNKTKIVLEIKSNQKNTRYKALTDSVMHIVKRMKAQAWVDYITFDYRALKLVRAYDATAHTAYLSPSVDLDLQKLDGMSGIDYHFTQFDKMERLYDRCRALGLTINVWTVNDEKVMDKMLDMGVDFITSDEPDTLLQKLEKRK